MAKRKSKAKAATKRQKPTDLTGKMSIVEVQEYCGVSLQYLYQLRTKKAGPKCKKIPVHGLGRGPVMRLYYDRASVEAWNQTRPGRNRKPKPKQQRKAKTPELQKAA